MANFPLDGVPSDKLDPGFYSQYFAAQGNSTSGASPRAALYFGPMLSSGSGTVNQPVQIKNEQEAIDKFGAGTPLHRAIRMHFKENKSGKVYACAYAETAGTAADGYANITGTATARGIFSVFVCGVESQVAVNSGDSGASIATKMVAAINAKTFLPVVASVASSTRVLLTAKVKGTSQGNGTIGVISLRASLTSGTGLTLAVTGAALGLGAGATAGVEGGTTEADNFEDALDVVANQRFYYMGATATSSTILSSFKTHLVLKATGGVGLRSYGLAAFTGTAAAAQALAVTQNYHRLSLVAQNKSDHDNAELLGWTLATFQREQTLDSRANMNGKRSSNLKAVYSAADWFDADDVEDLLSDGVIPISSDAAGGKMNRAVTTQSKNAAGSVDDRRALDVHRVSVGDEFLDEATNKYLATYQGFFQKDDKKKPDGSVDTTQVLPPKTLTPSTFKPFWTRLLRDYEKAGKLKNVDASVQSLAVDIDPLNTSRMEVQINLDVIDLHAQATTRANEVSAG